MTTAEWVSREDLKNWESDLAPAATRLASRILFNLTGRIYGGEKTCTEVYYPRSQALGDSLRALTLQRYGIGVCCSPFPYRLEITGDVRIPLRRRPVRAIDGLEVVQTGELVPSSEYWISDSTYLTVTGNVPVMSGLSVSYVYGTNPPEDGVEAARALADELIILFGDGPGAECRLKNVTSFSRQGVNYEIEDARTILTDGRTGIPEVDLFVASVNPTRARMRSRVLSPDAHMPR